MVTTDIDQVKLWLNQWDDVQKSRKIYRLLHDAFLSNEQRESASEMMIELLRTYPEESAGEAKDDATNCIVSFIDRPNVWIMDHLLELGPVRSLKEELIYQILEIFVSGSIKDYIKFYEENSNFVESTGEAIRFLLLQLNSSLNATHMLILCISLIKQKSTLCLLVQTWLISSRSES
ncbi:eukaryotic translation initiation factor 3 subunit M-like [Paramuricea clavata]|uniref:Eukaryotic translation initiation factor 3 subunit M-like n=1 Tax=Paramuricea clavata TaxID=317549 RepID=A0A6S7I3H9_PARCT|nr:eukaryotic translation initiation factor 3 subunit M-like [Paramuricea clavata]